VKPPRVSECMEGGHKVSSLSLLRAVTSLLHLLPLELGPRVPKPPMSLCASGHCLIPAASQQNARARSPPGTSYHGHSVCLLCPRGVDQVIPTWCLQEPSPAMST
jgi:hypothetical protein